MNTTTMTRPHWTRRFAFAAAPLAALTLAACGGGSDEPAKTDAQTAPVESASGDDARFRDAQFRWEMKFTACLRKEGIDVADPDPVKGAPDVEHDDAYLAASKACQGVVGAPPSVKRNAGKEREMHEFSLRQAACMRKEGIDTPDPAPGEFVQLEEGVDENVYNACADEAVKKR
ncbi:hypothetical protein [Patulibacter americanus]|uniref:hypothetical protein n=1 Tax=Patulibacter americanus TaxID=588672 RepID=UPI0003B7A5CB|nr:hypothetical protein [Patulibacter americanus]